MQYTKPDPVSAVSPDPIARLDGWKNVGDVWNRALRWYVPYIFFGLLIAISLGEDVLSTSSALSTLVEAISSWIPSIERISNIARAPEVAKTFGALMWAVQPLLTLLVLTRSPKLPVKKVSWTWLLVGYPLFIAMAFLLLVWMPFVFFDIDSETLSHPGGRGKVGLIFILNSRIGMGLLGSVILAASSFSQVIILKSIVYYPRLFWFNLTK